MKKIKLSLGIIALLAIAIIAANRSGNKLSQDAQPTPTPSSFTLVVINPDVMIKRSGDADFQKISDETSIAAGVEVKTSATGKARLLYPNGTITDIEKDSHIKVESLDAQGGQSRIRVVVGGIWSKIKNVLGTNEYYEVETENTVASVRGTIFSTEFRNKITKVTGIESRVRVKAKDAKTNTTIAGSDLDIESGEETTVDDKAVAAKRLAKRVLSNEDFRRDAIKEKILDHIDREDIQKDQVRQIVRRIREQNVNDRPFIQKLIERRLVEQDGSPLPTRSPLPTAKPTLTPRPTPTPTPVPTLKPTPTATPTPMSTPTPTPTPVPTAVSVSFSAESLSPKLVKVGQEFIINGKNFKNSRGDVTYVTQVMIGGMNAYRFNVLDQLSIFATPNPYLAPGTYDVTVMGSAGEKSTLSQSLTIQ